MAINKFLEAIFWRKMKNEQLKEGFNYVYFITANIH